MCRDTFCGVNHGMPSPRRNMILFLHDHALGTFIATSRLFYRLLSINHLSLIRPSDFGSPGTPDHRSRDLEHRCYSAAGLGHQQFEDLNDPTSCRQPVYAPGADSSDRDLLRSTSEQDKRQELHLIDACRSKGVVFVFQIPHLCPMLVYLRIWCDKHVLRCLSGLL